MNLDQVCNDALVRLYAAINGRIDRALRLALAQAEFNRRSFGQWLRWQGTK